MQNQFNVEYPQNLPDLLQVTKQAFEDEARMAMAVKLFELKRLSSGMAAELAGCSRVLEANGVDIGRETAFEVFTGGLRLHIRQLFNGGLYQRAKKISAGEWMYI
jgi:hypothetical protein